MKKKCLRKCIFVFFITTIVILVGCIAEKNMYLSTETANIIEEKVVIPGGQSIGVKMDVKGVLVVGLEEIETEDGIVSPAYEAGINVGDLILSIDGTDVSIPSQVEELVSNFNKDIEIELLRKNEVLKVKVLPVKSYSDGTFKIGIWVKERIAGIGTLTFYDPDTDIYGALGHGIYESKTGTLLQSHEGKLLKASVNSIREGQEGLPGEIRGIIYDESQELGEIVLNSEYGMYAAGADLISADNVSPIAVADQHQVKKGKAYILSTIKGNQVERFEIEITDINTQTEINDKGMEITVTDDRLLAACGGIVQGMSGSPIIQNGKLVGAVTHVLVDNPTKGYGIFAEWMLNTAELCS